MGAVMGPVREGPCLLPSSHQLLIISSLGKSLSVPFELHHPEGPDQVNSLALSSEKSLLTFGESRPFYVFTSKVSSVFLINASISPHAREPSLEAVPRT